MTTRLRPSFGFSLLVVSYGLLVVFLVWGYQQPELDKAWRILQALRRAEVPSLTETDAAFLKRQLQRHPEFAQALVGKSPIGLVESTEDGWTALEHSHLVLQGEQKYAKQVVVECRGLPAGVAAKMAFHAGSQLKELSCTSETQPVIDLSGLATGKPQWVDLTFTAPHPSSPISPKPEVRLHVDLLNTEK